MVEEPILRVERAAKVYGKRVTTHALREVDLTLGRGEFVALIGPSGSGKSTLLNLVGLLDRPTSGRIVLGGVDTTGLHDRGITELRAKMLGFIFQFHHLLPAFTATENVMLPEWGHQGFSSPAMRERARKVLSEVGLGDRLDNRTDELSGGQQQRVAVARALVRSPPLVLADEPTGNLDTASADEVFTLMRRFNHERGTAFLLVTHDPRIAERCDRVVQMLDGVIASDQGLPNRRPLKDGV